MKALYLDMAAVEAGTHILYKWECTHTAFVQNMKKKSFSSWQNTLIIVYLMRFPLKNNNHQSLKCFILLWTEDRLA